VCLLACTHDAPSSVPGRVPFDLVAACPDWHTEPVLSRYAASRHAAKGLRCEQCHKGAALDPGCAAPVGDGVCGGCHSAQYEQTLASEHFESRKQLALNDDPALRERVRRDGSAYDEGEYRVFVGDLGGGRGGRLCTACHYDGHGLGLSSVRQEGFCLGCHDDQDDHYEDEEEAEGFTNRCMACHVRVGRTRTGQIVNDHSFPEEE
jgi:hypothetical protein